MDLPLPCGRYVVDVVGGVVVSSAALRDGEIVVDAESVIEALSDPGWLSVGQRRDLVAALAASPCLS